MTTIDTSLTTSSSSTSSSEVSLDLSQSDFIELMLAQMTNQLPTDPYDSSALMDQTLQLSSLESMQNIESQLESLSASVLAAQSYQASSLIGNQVLVEGSEAELSGGSLTGVISSDTAATNATAKVYDADGNLVATLDLGTLSAGDTTFYWDGSTDDSALDSGIYTIEVTGTVDDETVELDTAFNMTVESVQFSSSGDAQLNLYSGSSVSLSDVQAVS